MFTRSIRVLALAGLLAAGAVPASAGFGPWHGGVAVPTVGSTVTVTHPTATVSAHVGDRIVVEMTTCAGSCGYQWKITSPADPTVVSYLSTSFRDQAPTGMVGGYQTQSVTFRAVGAGTTAVTWAYTPPGVNPVITQTYRLTFQIGLGSTQFATADRSGSATTAQTVQLYRVRTSIEGYYDRVVFDERLGVSGYTVKYVTRSEAGATGLSPKVAGTYFLKVTLTGTTTTVQPSSVPSVLTPRLPRVYQVRKLSESGNVVTFVIGSNQRHGFRVLQLTNPYRLVVDVRH